MDSVFTLDKIKVPNFTRHFFTYNFFFIYVCYRSSNLYWTIRLKFGLVTAKRIERNFQEIKYFSSTFFTLECIDSIETALLDSYQVII